MYSLIYSRDHRNCSPSPWHCSRCSLHTGIYTKCFHRYIPCTLRTVPLHPGIVHGIHYIRVYRWNMSVGILQRPQKLFPFTLTLFIVFIIYKYTNIICPSIYFRDHENYFPSPWQCSKCLLHMGVAPDITTIFKNSICERTDFWHLVLRWKSSYLKSRHLILWSLETLTGQHRFYGTRYYHLLSVLHEVGWIASFVLNC
jgi:hypothetical protein